MRNSSSFLKQYSADDIEGRNALGMSRPDDAVDAHVVGYTRCATAALASVTYFCGSAAAKHAALDTYAWHSVDELERSYFDVLSHGDPAAGTVPQAVWFVTLLDSHDPHVGHVWTLQMRGDGLVHHVQAYIRHYTLQQHLARSPPLDQEAVLRLFSRLRTIERASRWGEPSRAAYHAAFAVSLLDKVKQGSISVGATLACVVPPWSSEQGAADVLDPSHAEAVLALLPHAPPLRALSLARTADEFLLHDFVMTGHFAEGGADSQPFLQRDGGTPLTD